MVTLGKTCAKNVSYGKCQKSQQHSNKFSELHPDYTCILRQRGWPILKLTFLLSGVIWCDMFIWSDMVLWGGGRASQFSQQKAYFFMFNGCITLIDLLLKYNFWLEFNISLESSKQNLIQFISVLKLQTIVGERRKLYKTWGQYFNIAKERRRSLIEVGGSYDPSRNYLSFRLCSH